MATNGRRWNWHLWLGFFLCLSGFVGYLPLVRFPFTRDVPWVSFLFFVAGVFSLGIGLKRAFASPEDFRGKIIGPILSIFSIAVIGLFCFFIFYAAKQLPHSTGAPRVGQKAPDFSLLDANQQNISLAALLTTPLPGSQKVPKGVLLIFYRGYWWPFCNSELRGIEEHLTELEDLGVRPVAISVDSPEASRDLCRKAGYSFTFLSDANAEVIRRYDLLHVGGGENGRDIARPAEFLLDSSGVIRWVNLTGDLRIRMRPEEAIRQAKKLS